MKRQLHPPIFSDDDLWAIAQASAVCQDAISRLVELLRQIRSFRFGDVRGIPIDELTHLRKLGEILDAEVSFTLYQFLLQAGFLIDNWIDLDALSQHCLYKAIAELKSPQI